MGGEIKFSERVEGSSDPKALYKGFVEYTLRSHWKLFLIEGIVLVILGLAAVMLPLIATLATAILVGWVFLLSGIIGLAATFRMRHAPGFWWSLLSGIIGIAAGIVLLRWPLSGALSLTLVLTIFLVLDGRLQPNLR